MDDGADPQNDFTPADRAALALIWIVLIARCLVAGRGVMWLDELFSYRIVHDPSVPHLLAALGDQADGAPPVYYLLAKIWSGLFTGSALSLRLFSTVGFCAGFTVLWITVRQAAAFFPTALAFATILGGNEIISFESLNARFYGLLFALACLALFLGIRLCRSVRPSPVLLMGNILTNALLVLCHPLGGFYSVAILAGVVVSDLLSKPAQIRPRLILSYFAGWAALLLWLRQFFRQADIDNPHGWLRMPVWSTLIDEWREEAQPQDLLLFALILGGAFLFAARLRPTASPRARVQTGLPHRVYVVMALSLIALTPAFWIISRIFPHNSIFFGRYLLVPLIGWTVVYALIIDYGAKRISFRMSPVSGALAGLFVLYATHLFWEPPVKQLFAQAPQDPRAYLTGISDGAFDHEALPIVCPRSEDFLPRVHDAPDAGRYYFLLDWQAATNRKAFPSAVMDYKILSAIKRHYPDAGNIMPASDFLRDHPVFLLQDVSQYRWPSLYLKPGMYTITRLEPSYPLSYGHEGEWPLLLVEKKQ
jgi:hypothetical protein